MSEATTKALADLIYDRIVQMPCIVYIEDNNDIYAVARTAAETIEAAGLRVPKQEQIGWAHQVITHFVGREDVEQGWDLLEAWEPEAIEELKAEGVKLIPVWRDLP